MKVPMILVILSFFNLGASQTTQDLAQPDFFEICFINTFDQCFATKALGNKEKQFQVIRFFGAKKKGRATLSQKEGQRGIASLQQFLNAKGPPPVSNGCHSRIAIAVHQGKIRKSYRYCSEAIEPKRLALLHDWMNFTLNKTNPLSK